MVAPPTIRVLLLVVVVVVLVQLLVLALKLLPAQKGLVLMLGSCRGGVRGSDSGGRVAGTVIPIAAIVAAAAPVAIDAAPRVGGGLLMIVEGRAVGGRRGGQGRGLRGTRPRAVHRDPAPGARRRVPA